MTISNQYMAANAPFYLEISIPSVAIFKPKMSVFCWYSTFLLSHHQAFYGVVRFCDKPYFLLNQLIFADSSIFFPVTATFCWFN